MSQKKNTRALLAAAAIVNNSKTKQMYSFSKSERFPSPKSPYSSQAFYEIPSAEKLNSNGAGFGHGNRFRYKPSATPSPSEYNLPKVGKQPCYSFGNPRSSTDDLLKQSRTPVPGPGTY